MKGRWGGMEMAGSIQRPEGLLLTRLKDARGGRVVASDLNEEPHAGSYYLEVKAPEVWAVPCRE